jgi:hypothetical protein
MTAKYLVVGGMLLGCVFTTVAHAQVAIDTTAVAAGGITSGDTPGYPATISQTGSYKLTSSLPVLGTTLDAIDITASDVTLDLNGFSVSSGKICNWASTGSSCLGSNTGQILINISGSRVTVKNGNVRGSNGDGIDITGDQVVLDGINVSNTGWRGIYSVVSHVPPTITNSSVTLSGNVGLISNSLGIVGGAVRNSTFSNNYGGMELDQGLIENVIAGYNIMYGISAGGSTVNHATVLGNGSTGVSSGRIVRDSVSDQNGADGFSNSNAHTLYINSHAEGNVGKGFNLTSAACYSNIAADGNTAGHFVGGVQLRGTHVTCQLITGVKSY